MRASDPAPLTEADVWRVVEHRGFDGARGLLLLLPRLATTALTEERLLSLLPLTGRTLRSTRSS